ncbi:hypothetical protein CIB48_g4172 [Xylaria polymorpha]|nr:hypothetical protein CIB48_g4172 [Xylaria polymorpha]
MTNSSKQDITYEGESPSLHVTVENEGWSNLQPVLSFSASRSSRSSRSQLPHPLLRLPRVATTTHETDALNDVKSRPTFDLGLGCFGDPLPDARPDELTSADESLNGNQTRTNESQIGASYEDEEESYSDDSDPASRISGGSDLLRDLDNLEAARPKPEKQAVMPGDKEGIWRTPNPVKLNFDSWIDEIAALEESDSMPKGTRYYKVEGSGDSTYEHKSPPSNPWNSAP